ncbi:HEAT repeat domain-containing protein [Spartinivicinus poritis]|uniref:HEAT repeat domain-containing protein n=1 Tax=Spartinivicinus poritis TaxID=2994640 RepID=A0ABT5UBI5_9GAMM|nr:HEAT repeat domain-containing protein [Spartinivicinus sp. A2-2]MDE1463732.1 HEAT repeat domain-containing protein [Spartinivicinus sp. A2-2]
MKLLRKETLYYQQGNSDKVYEVDLCECNSLSADRYLVNFRYGKRGSRLREGTKTPNPVSLTEAEEIYTSIVVNKQNKGYISQQPDQANSTAGSVPGTTRQQHILVKLNDKSAKVRTRAIWRIGELGLIEATDQLIELIGKGKPRQDYCIAWALGRLANNKANDVLLLMCQHKNEAVARIAREAWLRCIGSAERTQYISSVIDALPEPLQAKWGRDQGQALADTLLTAIGHQGQNTSLLLPAYQIASNNPVWYQALLQAMESLPIQPNFFKAFRHLLKAAELRLDGNMLGVLFKRMDQTQAFFHAEYGRGYLPGSWKSVSVASETKKSDSCLAYSQRTRDYLRRRSMRLLRRLGEADDSRYLDVAVGVLNAITDADTQDERRSEVYRWSQDGRWQRELVATKYYDGYAPYLAFNFVLHHYSQQYVLASSKRAWQLLSEPGDIGQPESMTEAFPELWDRQPDRLFQLLQNNRCNLVHQFAVRAIQRHPLFCQQVLIEDWLGLLSSVYQPTAALALHYIIDRFDISQPDWRVILGCLNAAIVEAREQALDWLATVRQPDSAMLIKLWVVLITSPYQEVRQWAKHQQYQLHQLDAATLLPELVTVLKNMDDGLLTQVVDDVSWLLCEKLITTSRQLPINWIEQLVAFKQPSLKLLGAHLLEVNKIGYAELPGQLLQQIAQGDSLALKAMGVRLLNKMTDHELRQQAAALIAYVQSGDAVLRQAALPLLLRLTRADQRFADNFIQQMLPVLFQSEAVEGQHDDIISLLSEQLTSAIQRLNKDTTWRLLQARSRGAQRLGWVLFKHHFEQFSVRQWAVLGNHPLAGVRQQVINAFNEYPARIKAAKADALRILVTEWEDVRQFALDYFRHQFTATDWEPELLVHLVDHVEDVVQQFGRELITQYFTPELGPQLLMQLSQHPAANVQLFVSHFLQDYAAGNPERIISLRPYFLTVLSQINRGRVAKDRVFQFLTKEALANERVAEMVVELFNHLSLTVVIGDKAIMIEALLQLQYQYPQLTSVIKTCNLPLRSVV